MAEVSHLLVDYLPIERYRVCQQLSMNLLDAFLFHGMCNILHQHRISKAWMHCLSPFLVVQVSEAYIATGKIMTQTILVLVQAEMSLSFQMLLSLAMADLPQN